MSSRNATIFPKRLADAYFTGTFRLMLVSALPDEAAMDAAEFRSNITNEVTGAGYTAGGALITATVGAKDATSNRVAVTLGSVTWPAATVTARGGWLYKVVGSAATDQVIAYVDFGGPIASTGGEFVFTPAAPLYVNA
jgi:hypothetical protein